VKNPSSLLTLTLQVQSLFDTGFNSTRGSTAHLSVSGRQETLKKGDVTCDEIYEALQKHYPTGRQVLIHYERTQWHTWVYDCVAINTSGPDCIAIIKVFYL